MQAFLAANPGFPIVNPGQANFLYNRIVEKRPPAAPHHERRHDRDYDA